MLTAHYIVTVTMVTYYIAGKENGTFPAWNS